MRVEVVGKGFVYRWPGGEVRLEPGRLIELPDERGQKLVAKVGARVRVVQPTDWLSRWRELAHMTAGLEPEDPRLTPVLSAFAACEAHDKAGDRSGFEHATQRVHYVMQFKPGAQVRWHGSEGHALKVLGPAPVEHVHCANGQLWVWTAWKGQGRWVPERSITAMEDRGAR